MSGPTPKTFAKTDTLGSYADSPFAIRRTMAASFTADPLGSYADTLGALRALRAALESDELGFGASSGSVTARQFQIPGGPYVNEVTDQKEFQIPGGQYLNETTSASVTEHDSLQWVAGIPLAYSDALGSYSDSYQVLFSYLVRVLDDLNAWLDSVDAVLTSDLLPLTAAFSDALGSYADALRAELAYLVSRTDALGGYADTLAGRLAYLASHQDALGGYSDTFQALLVHLVRFTDDLNNWADEVAKVLTGEAALTASFTDSLNNWNDALAAILTSGAIQPGDEVQVITVGGIECHVLINGDLGAVPVRVVIASPKQITVLINGETGASPIHVTI